VHHFQEREIITCQDSPDDIIRLKDQFQFSIAVCVQRLYSPQMCVLDEGSMIQEIKIDAWSFGTKET